MQECWQMARTYRVLISGGAGFIGSHILESYLKKGWEVAVLDNLSTGKRENVPPHVKLYVGDVRDPRAVERVIKDFRPTHISHQAAQASVPLSVKDPVTDAQVNIVGGLHVLEAARRYSVTHIVFASTGGAIYGEVPEGAKAHEEMAPQPVSPYGASKLAFERYLHVFRHLYGLRCTILRYGNVYGPRQDPQGEAGVVAIFASRLLKKQPVKLYAMERPGDEGCIRDYIFVSDVVDANLIAIEQQLEGVFNVGTGIGRRTLEVLRAIEEAVGEKAQVQFEGPRPGDLRRSVLDPTKLMNTGWRPLVDFPVGIKVTVEAFRSQLS